MEAIVLDNKYTIEITEEVDGRWIAEVLELPGVIVYGETEKEAVKKAMSLTLQVLIDSLENKS